MVVVVVVAVLRLTSLLTIYLTYRLPQSLTLHVM